MRKIRHPTRRAARPAQTYSDAANGGFFTEGDPATALAATAASADALNDVQGVLLATITTAGHSETAGAAGDAHLTEAIKLHGHAWPTTLVNTSPYNITASTAGAKAAATGRLYLVDCALAAITINLPPAADAASAPLAVKKIDATANAVTIDGSGNETVAGAANLTLDDQHEATLLLSDGTGWSRIGGRSPSGVVTSGGSAGHLSGLTLANNGTDPTNDIDVSAGSARADDDDADIALAAGLTKRLDATFANGTGAGGLDTGAKANTTHYHVFAIGDADETLADVLLSASLSPSMPSGYAKKRRIGSIWTDGSGVIRPFVQAGELFLWKAPPLDVNGSSVGAGNTTNLTLTVAGDVRVEALLNVRVSGTDGTAYLRPTDADDLDATQATGGAPLATLEQHASYSPDYYALQAGVLTDTSRRIAANAPAGQAVTLHVATLGWRDRRGMD